MDLCNLCPRSCNVDRETSRGVCRAPREISIAKIMLHKWEEPCISGNMGSGAIFFRGCPLGCVFCQNRDISRCEKSSGASDLRLSEDELACAMLELQSKGAHNINLVSPTQYTDVLIRVVKKAKEKGLRVPIVWNTGGYEKPEVIDSLKGTVDVFLTDVKYFSKELSQALSHAPDYFEYAVSSLLRMCEVAGKPRFDGDIMTGGVIVRHLILPSCRHDSVKILEALAKHSLTDRLLFSLMSQYTPDFYSGCADAALDRAMKRRVTTFEYNFVRDEAERLGFDGYGQDRKSASKSYTPDWSPEADNQTDN